MSGMIGMSTTLAVVAVGKLDTTTILRLESILYLISFAFFLFFFFYYYSTFTTALSFLSSLPHGFQSLVTAIVTTIAWIVAFNAVTDCHFLIPEDYLYCHPPPPKAKTYGTCGDCHCINLDQPCPDGPGKVPLTTDEIDNDWLGQLKAMKATNPYQMRCNPYNTTGNYLNCTNPPLKEYQVELWETAVCGHVYDMDSLDENMCPTQYEMVTYDTKEELEAAGAVHTHWGAVSTYLCIFCIVPGMFLLDLYLTLLYSSLRH
jgi:hypothetical protein